MARTLLPNANNPDNLKATTNEPAPAGAWRVFLQHLLQGQLDLDDLWLVVPPLLILLMEEMAAVQPNDFWWHLRTGQIIIASGAIPISDAFSFTRLGAPWFNQAWMTQIGLFLVYKLGGMPLEVMFDATMIGLAYVILGVACRQNRAIMTRASGMAVFMAAIVGYWNFGLRPQLASFPLFALLVLLLERHTYRGGIGIWWLPPLFALWANVHGGFVFGLGLLAIYVCSTAGEELWRQQRLSGRTQHLLGAAAVSLLAISLNPAGPLGMGRYLLGFFQNDATQGLNVEFMPLSIRNQDGLAVFTVLIVYLAIVLHRRLTLSTRTAVVLVVFGLATLYTRRVAPWFGMAMAPAFAAALEREPGPEARPGGRKLAANYALLAAVTALAVISVPWLRPYFRMPAAQPDLVQPGSTPQTAAGELCRMGPGVRVYTSMEYASYLEWACPGGAVQVFVDCRVELYPLEIWRDFLLIDSASHGWAEILQSFGANTLMLDKQQQALLLHAAKDNRAWHTVYEDDRTVILQLTAKSTGAAN